LTVYSKGKLERWHRTFREQFLSELNVKSIHNLDDLNHRLWAWIDLVYHSRPHCGLNNKTPLECWRQELTNVRQLGALAAKIDHIFYHRYKRKVRNDGTVQWNGFMFEVPFRLVGMKVYLIVDPLNAKALWVESESGENLGAVTLLNKVDNNNRKRSRPILKRSSPQDHSINTVDLAYEEYYERYHLDDKEKN
jgi:putative transposase